MSHTPPLLYVLILNWNRPRETIACLKAVTQSDYPNLRVVVLDNGSKDDSVTRIKQAFPEIPLIENGANLGYAEGNNVGIRLALQKGAKYIVLLNDDAIVEKESFRHLVAAVGAEPTVAAVGAKIRLFEQPERLWAAGECFPRGERPLDDGRFDKPREISYAVGCCMLMTRQAVEEVGLLDADLFALHEELDWCLRARQAGYRILYEPQAVVYHKVSVSLSSGYSAAYHYLYTRNYLRFWERSGIIPQNWRRLRGVFLVWRHELGMIKRYGDSKWHRAWAVTYGAFDYLRGRFGPPPESLLR